MMIMSSSRIVFIIGLSGAGRSSALRIFEDIGYRTIDNLPLGILEHFLTTCNDDGVGEPLAIGLTFSKGIPEIVLFQSLLKKYQAYFSIKIIFLDADTAVLIRRYSITRRRHPVSGESVRDAIERERGLLNVLHSVSDYVIDTSEMAIASLMRLLRNIFALESVPVLQVRLISFSYRHGLPAEADIVMDARFLKNPHYVPDLQYLTGRDEAVQTFIVQQNAWEKAFIAMTDLIALVVCGVKQSGRSYLTIAIGCTGGQHRSVFTVEKIAEFLKSQKEHVTVVHRELGEKELL